MITGGSIGDFLDHFCYSPVLFNLLSRYSHLSMNRSLLLIKSSQLLVFTALVFLKITRVTAEKAVLSKACSEPSKSANELGIIKFSQSPILSGLELPGVKVRLDKDQLVVFSLADIGRNRSTMRITRHQWLTFPNSGSPMTTLEDMRRRSSPNVAESWQTSPDDRSLTLTLRDSIKWSDGQPLVSDDFLFFFNDIWLYKEFDPIPRRMVRVDRVVKVDCQTFYCEFENPNPLVVKYEPQYGSFHIADSVLVMRHVRIAEQGPLKNFFCNLNENYTKLSLSAIPSLDPDIRNRPDDQSILGS